MPVRFQLVIDCADPDRLARFWAAALGYELAPVPAGFATWNDFYRELGVPEEDLVDGADRISDPDGHGPTIWFHVVPEGNQTVSRMRRGLRIVWQTGKHPTLADPRQAQQICWQPAISEFFNPSWPTRCMIDPVDTISTSPNWRPEAGRNPAGSAPQLPCGTAGAVAAARGRKSANDARS